MHETTAAAPAAGRILLVDDEASVRTLLRQVLVREGYEVATAASGREALALCDSGVPDVDLLITDLIMPGANGLAVACRLREHLPAVRVLVMSGDTQHPLLEEVLAGGAEFVGKPFSTSTFIRVVRAALAGQRAA